MEDVRSQSAHGKVPRTDHMTGHKLSLNKFFKNCNQTKYLFQPQCKKVGNREEKKTALKTTQRHGNCTAYFWIKEDTEKDTRINLSTHTTHEKVWWMNHQEGSCWQSGLARKKPKALKHLPPCHKTKTMGEAKAKASVIEEIIKIREGANKTEAKKIPSPNQCNEAPLTWTKETNL